ncbi:MAG: DNA polymerase III subunit delta [Erysipelotrichales bacterium]|nr:DNA polymerase III subunit delta [Erysipelotrichales bacterium]
MASIHLISSSSYHVTNNLIKKIADGNTNITYESLTDMSIYDCIDDASYFGLFTENRVIVIKDVKYFGGKFNYEDETNALYEFLKKLDESITIIFICDTISKTKDITKKVINLGAEIYAFETLDDNILKETISEYAHEYDLLIDDNARDQILKNSLNNLDVAINDIEKISVVNKHITLDLVNTYGIKLESINNFDFSNAVVAKNFNKAFELLDSLIANDTDIFSIFGALASSYTNMYMVRDAVSHGLSDEEIAEKLGYSGTNRVFVLKKNAKIYTTDELKEIIISLSELDIKLKNGYDPVYEIKEFLLNL